MRELGGKTLVRLAVEVALAAQALGVVNRVVVSVEDGQTEQEALNAGASVHWREHAIRTPDATVLDTMHDYLNSDPDTHSICSRSPECGHGQTYDAVCLLLPSSPLRTLRHIVESRLLLDHETDVVMSVTPFRQDMRYALVDAEDRLSRVTEEYGPGPYYKHDGHVIWAWAERMLKAGFYDGRVRSYHISPEESCDVDTALDLQLAEFLLARRATPPEKERSPA